MIFFLPRKPSPQDPLPVGLRETKIIIKGSMGRCKPAAVLPAASWTLGVVPEGSDRHLRNGRAAGAITAVLGEGR